MRNCRLCITVVTSRPHILTSHIKMCLIAGKDFISTLLLAWGGQWQSVSDLTFALLVDVTKLDIFLDVIWSLCYLFACSTFLMNNLLLQWDLKPGKWNSTPSVPNIYDLTQSIQSQCKKQKSESTQTHKYTLSHMYVDMMAYFQTDIHLEINVPSQTVWKCRKQFPVGKLHSLPYMQRHMEPSTKTSTSATILKKQTCQKYFCHTLLFTLRLCWLFLTRRIHPVSASDHERFFWAPFFRY